MAKVKSVGHICGLVFNWNVCFMFCGNGIILSWDIPNSIFDLENSMSRSCQNQPKSNQVIYRSGQSILPKMKEIWKVVWKLSRQQSLRRPVVAAAYEPVQKHQVTPSILGDLTHWSRVTHICVGKLTIIGSDNGLSPGRRQAIIWTIAGILLIGPLGTNFSEILIGIQTFPFKKMHLKMSSVKWCPFVWASMC